MDFPKKLSDAIDQLGKIPGVGRKTAIRQALYLTNWSREDLANFSNSMSGLSNLNNCHECGLLCDESICEICRKKDQRQKELLCVVESVSDCLAIEQSGQYRGLYHILGGVLNPLLGVGPDKLNLSNLQKRIEENDVKNVILALNSSVEGDATCGYLNDLFGKKVVFSRIGFGIPMGGSLEYLDSMTISKALENLKQM